MRSTTSCHSTLFFFDASVGSQKSEENFAVAEAELEKQTTFATELTRKVEDLQIKADEAVRLKDQVDEYADLQK